MEKVQIVHPFLPYNDPAVVTRRSFERVWAARGWELAEPEQETEKKEEDESWLAEQDSSSAFGF